MSGSQRLIAGAMSGTSADGVDVAITEITGRGLDMTAKLVRHHHRAYDPALKTAIFKLRESGQTTMSELARIGREISLTYATAVNEALVAAQLKPSDLSAIAAHGQTLYHNPPDTIQWLDPALIAAAVGCPVISDFRRADCAAGGQGAPLVPFADYILFRHPQKSRVLLNIGGIANVTNLPAGCALDQIRAYDVGPGNCVIDHLCRTLDPSGPGFDRDGLIAQRGRPIEEIVQVFAGDEFSHRPPPKSTDGPAMISIFEDAVNSTGKSHRFEDLIATAAFITADRIVASVAPEAELIGSGGGMHNRVIRELIEKARGMAIRSTDEFGVPSQAKEALAFALLGAATLDGVPSNVPSATGARRAVVLGSITPKPA